MNELCKKINYSIIQSRRNYIAYPRIALKVLWNLKYNVTILVQLTKRINYSSNNYKIEGFGKKKMKIHELFLFQVI